MKSFIKTLELCAILSNGADVNTLVDGNTNF